MYLKWQSFQEMGRAGCLSGLVAASGCNKDSNRPNILAIILGNNSNTVAQTGQLKISSVIKRRRNLRALATNTAEQALKGEEGIKYQGNGQREPNK